MQSYRKVEIIVGIFVLVGVLSMSWMAIKLGQIGGMGSSGYTLSATFDDAGGLRVGADVMMAGVSIGRLSSVALNDDSEAVIHMEIQNDVHLSTDAIAAVRTKGIIGERYVRMSQGADDAMLASGDEIEETESAINIEDLISKYIFQGKE
ncbi:MAG: outer membrane lipid asymmetry maintenance protein MlaD [Zetaproteobacteria bacterium]|nr:outer membrane lipid asymmetry maintenance protein MlaD [Zetaproteobacteria bacterium]